MKNYYDFLVLKGLKVNYINSNDENSDIRKFIDQLNSTEIDKIQCIDPEDNWLEKRLRESSKKKGIDLVLLENPAFKMACVMLSAKASMVGLVSLAGR